MLTDDVLDNEGYIEKVRFDGGIITGAEDERLSFDDVLFKDVSFSGSELKASRIR